MHLQRLWSFKFYIRWPKLDKLEKEQKDDK
jgi:hypothetical protein